MSDILFHTLLATLAACMNHMQSMVGITEPHITWYPGFEQCAKIEKAVDKEKERRQKETEAAKDAVDKALLENGLAALAGKKFEEKEAPPALPTSPWFNCLSTGIMGTN